jgi:hypothetical protein
MKTATALTLATIGAILVFAVNAQPSFFSFHVAGWVLMLAGAVGAVVPRRGSGWRRRRVVMNTDQRRTDVVQRRDVGLPQDSLFSRLVMPDGPIKRRDIDFSDSFFSRILPDGLVTEYRDVEVDADPTEGKIESDTVEEYIQE